MKRTTFVLAFILLMTGLSLAQYQPAVEWTGNYHFTHVNLPAGLGGLNVPAGFGSTVNVPINNWVGVVGDFGYMRKSASGGNVSLSTFGGGPRFTYRTKRGQVQPYFQFVLGGAHVAASANALGSAGTTAFMILPGGGIQLKASKTVWFNVGFNYLHTNIYGYGINGFQPSVGVSFHFGGPSGS